MPSFSKNLGPISYTTIKEHLECTPVNIAEDISFNEFTSIKNLNKNRLSFLTDTHFSRENILSDGTILCSQSINKKFKYNNPLIIVDDVHSAVAKLSNIFYRPFTLREIESLDKPKIGSNCNISETAVIENGSIIGKNVNISAGCYVGHNCIIGDNTSIDSNTVVSNSIIAENINIGRNSSIGQQGFGFAISTVSYTHLTLPTKA